MKIILLTLALIGVAATAELPVLPSHCLLNRPVLLMAQEGNPGHHEPPPGWSCANTTNTPADHKCACHRTCHDYPGGQDEDGNVIPPSTQVVEDAKCLAYCFKDHCRCGISNCD